ncbi:hypothetical protein NMY22_g19485 [Coprinellus aureogranulatus]|nr:hypothetical protein NMY22_g19485 [Coprinellus aureogranulatus]
MVDQHHDAKSAQSKNRKDTAESSTFPRRTYRGFEMPGAHDRLDMTRCDAGMTKSRRSQTVFRWSEAKVSARKSMWPNYNAGEAVLSLNSYIAKVAQEETGDQAFSDLDLTGFVVVQDEHTRALRIVSADDQNHELVTKVVGILCSKTLPPVRGTLQSREHRHLKKLRQYVKVSGGGSPLFDDYETKFHAVLNFFSQVVPREQIEVTNPSLFDGHYALDFHTRYFEERRYAPQVLHIPFEPSVDPEGVLEGARGVDFVHGEGNIVEYCTKVYDAEGKPRYEVQAPERFAVATSSSIRYKLVPGMRVLSQLDHQFAKEMRQANADKYKRVTNFRRIPRGSPRRKFLANRPSSKGDSGVEEGGSQDMETT